MDVVAEEVGEETGVIYDKTLITDLEDMTTRPRLPSSMKVSLISRAPMLVSRRRTWSWSSSRS